MRRSVITLMALCLVLAACGDDTETGSAVTAAAATTQPAAATTEASTTTAPPALITTTTAATTTTTAAITTTERLPNIPYDELTVLEPGSHIAVWNGPSFILTVEAPTEAFLGEYRDYLDFQPFPRPEWVHPRASAMVALTIYSHLISYEAGGREEVPVPNDPTSFLTEHPFLDVGEPSTFSLDGYEGVQFDAVVTGHAGTDFGSLVFAGYSTHALQEPWPVGASVRIAFVNVEGDRIWIITQGTAEASDQAVEYSEQLIAGIHFR